MRKARQKALENLEQKQQIFDRNKKSRKIKIDIAEHIIVKYSKEHPDVFKKFAEILKNFDFFTLKDFVLKYPDLDFAMELLQYDEFHDMLVSF